METNLPMLAAHRDGVKLLAATAFLVCLALAPGAAEAGQLPDLTPEAFNMRPITPTTTDTVRVSWVVRAAVIDVPIHVTCALTIDGRVDTLFPCAGGEAITAVRGPFEAGVHTIGVEVDTQNRVAESDEGNNTDMDTFTVVEAERPDLRLRPLRLRPRRPTATDPVRIRFKLAGRAPAAIDLRCSVWIDDRRVARLPCAPRAVLTLVVDPLPVGRHEVRVAIDDDDRLAETDEGNNVRTRRLRVR